MLTPKANLAPEHWRGPVPSFTRAFRASIAYRLCLIADGSFDGVLSFSDVWEWDSAAGAQIASRAGATVTDRHNAALLFNSENAQSRGILAASPGLHRNLITRMQT